MSNNLSVQKITFLALTIAAAIVGRTLFITLPNVQPVTDIILAVTLYMGFIEGSCVALLTIFITNLYMGMGIWTVFQIISYIILVFITSLIRRILVNHYYLQIIHSFGMGFLYGLVISLLQAVSFMGFEKFLPYYMAGLSFDLLHALGNAILYVLFIPVFIKLMRKYKMKDR